MTHFAYTRMSGVWNAGIPVLHGELADFDAKTTAAINGDGGGVWAPAATIVIGGAGLNVSGFTAQTTLHAVGAATFDGDVTLGDAFGDTITINGTSTFNAAASLLHNVVLGDTSARTLTVNATSAFASPAAFAAGGSLGTTSGDTWTVNATAQFQAQAGFQDGFVAHATSAFIGDLEFTSSGSLVERVVIGTGASATYSVSTADTVFVPNSLTGTYTYTLDHVGAVAGKKMRIALEAFSSGMEIDLLDIVSGRIPLANRLANSAGNYTSIDVQYISGAWKMTAFSPAF